MIGKHDRAERNVRVFKADLNADKKWKRVAIKWDDKLIDDEIKMLSQLLA